MTHEPDWGLVVAVHPTSKGFGWAVFEGPLAPVDWGIATSKGNRSAHAMHRFQELLNLYRPSVVVLEEYKGARRHARIQDLAQSMRGLAINRDIDVAIYPRSLVCKLVAHDPLAKRFQVAEAVCDLLPILRFRLPPKRKAWQTEDPRHCVFTAAALAIAHFRISRPHH